MNEFIIRKGFISNSGSTVQDFLNVSGHTTSKSFITSGGTSSDFTKGDGTLDPNTYALLNQLIPNTDDYTTGATFNTSTGILEFARQSGTTYNIDLDGRYALSGTTGSDDYVDSGAFNTSTGDLTLTRLSGGTVVTNLDDRYSLTGHSHSGIGVWEVITTNTTAVENGKYITNSGSRLVVTLPTTNNLETIRIIGRGVGGWQIDVPNAWSLLFVDETITDNIQSTEISDSVELMSNGNNTYQVISSTGNITFNNL